MGILPDVTEQSRSIPRAKAVSEPPLYAFGLHEQLWHNRLRHAISPNCQAWGRRNYR